MILDCVGTGRVTIRVVEGCSIRVFQSEPLIPLQTNAKCNFNCLSQFLEPEKPLKSSPGVSQLLV